MSALRISAACDGGELVPVGFSGVEEWADPGQLQPLQRAHKPDSTDTRHDTLPSRRWKGQSLPSRQDYADLQQPETVARQQIVSHVGTIQRSA